MSGASRPLRFCHLTTFFPPENLGGDGLFVARLAAELVGRGHHVEVIHDPEAYRLFHPAPPPAAGVAPPGVVVHRLETGMGALSPLITQQLGVPGPKSGTVRRVLREGRFDVIHYHNISLVGGPGVLAYGDAVKLYSIHEHWLVCPMHTLWRYDREICPGKECVRCQIHGGRPPQLWRYTGLLERSLKHVDAFIAPSRFTLERHRKELPIPMVRIPYFHPDGSAPAAPPPARPGARPYFLFVGRLERIKGVQVLIDLFRTYDKADLLVAGSGEHEGALRKQAAGLDRIKFLGRLSWEELDPLYRGATALLVPSLCLETFGLVLIEAFSRGVPVVAHAVGPFPEILEESGAGFTYASDAELAAALDRLIGEPALRAELGRTGRAAYERSWTPEAHLAAYFALIAEIAARTGRPDLAARAAAAF